MKNLLAYYWIRVLQKLGLATVPLAIGKGMRCMITDPPGMLKTFISEEGRKRFEDDASLRAVRTLVRSAESFWDVGANCGLFSLFARDENPKLFLVSIEPSTEAYHALCANWSLQPSDRWICLHTAVGECDGTARLTRLQRGYDHIVESENSDAQTDIETRPMTTLDRLARVLGVDSIDVLKLDVEGYELRVLRGAADLFGRHCIRTVVMESDGHCSRYGNDEGEAIRFLEERGYRLDPALSQTGGLWGNCLVFGRDDESVERVKSCATVEQT